jgi:hypothetical protein
MIALAFSGFTETSRIRAGTSVNFQYFPRILMIFAYVLQFAPPKPSFPASPAFVVLRYEANP